MWLSSSGGMPDPELLRRMNPPDNEIPVVLPVNALLARTEQAALALLSLEVSSTGLLVHLTLRVPSTTVEGSRQLHEILRTGLGPGPAGGGLLVGMEFADGRRVTNGRQGRAMTGPPERPVFHQSRGSGGPASQHLSWWLTPLPPEGPLRFVVRCDALRLEETSTELDGDAIRAAAAGAVELWPWTPPGPPRNAEVRPPDVPPDSWFAR